jgi:hypothetical protein
MSSVLSRHSTGRSIAAMVLLGAVAATSFAEALPPVGGASPEVDSNSVALTPGLVNYFETSFAQRLSNVTRVASYQSFEAAHPAKAIEFGGSGVTVGVVACEQLKTRLQFRNHKHLSRAPPNSL